MLDVPIHTAVAHGSGSAKAALFVNKADKASFVSELGPSAPPHAETTGDAWAILGRHGPAVARQHGGAGALRLWRGWELGRRLAQRSDRREEEQVGRGGCPRE